MSAALKKTTIFYNMQGGQESMKIGNACKRLQCRAEQTWASHWLSQRRKGELCRPKKRCQHIPRLASGERIKFLQVAVRSRRREVVGRPYIAIFHTFLRRGPHDGAAALAQTSALAEARINSPCLMHGRVLM